MAQSVNQLKSTGTSTKTNGGGSGFDLGSLLSGATSVAGTIGGWAGGIKNAAQSQVNTYGLDYINSQVESPYDIANMKLHSIDTNTINAPSRGKQALGVFKNIGEGAAAGSSINIPWGTIVGAVAGLGTGVAKAALQNNTYYNDIAKANRENIYSYKTMNSIIDQGIDKLYAVSGLSDRFNNIMAKGGTMNKQYTNQNLYNTNNNVIGAGNTHELNPNGGVPQGIDGSGNPNLVEEGEFVYTDLDSGEKRVLSNRIKPDPALLSKHNLNERLLSESYAKSAEKIVEMFDGRNDPFSNKTKNMLLNRLFEAQEEQKINEAAAEHGMTPEEYIAAIQQQQADEQAAQQQMAMQQQQYPQEVMQLAQQYGVSPEEIIAQVQQQQNQQSSSEMMAYDGSIMPDETDMMGNYGALGGTFEYGPDVEYSPIMGYDNYLLERSRVNTQPVNYYAAGGPPTGKKWLGYPGTTVRYPENLTYEERELYSPASSYYNKEYPTRQFYPTLPEPTYKDYENIISKNTRQFYPTLPDIERSDELANYSPVENKDRVRPNWEQIKNTIGIMNPLRFANAIDSFSSWVNPEKLDTWYSDFLKGEYSPIPYTGPIGRHQEFQPVDAYRNLGIAQASRAAAIARNNAMSPNSRANVATNMAVDRMYSNQLGDMYAHETQQDIDRLNNIIAYNNQLDAENNERLNERHRYNIQHRADTIGRSALAYEASKDARKAAIDQARSAYFDDMSKIGQELSYRASIDSNPSLAYSSYNQYKLAQAYDMWLRENGLEDTPEAWEQFTQTM